jgi:hypothetical protein
LSAPRTGHVTVLAVVSGALGLAVDAALAGDGFGGRLASLVRSIAAGAVARPPSDDMVAIAAALAGRSNGTTTAGAAALAGRLASTGLLSSEATVKVLVLAGAAVRTGFGFAATTSSSSSLGEATGMLFLIDPLGVARFAPFDTAAT